MLPKIISIIGARPQFIKHAPVSLALEKRFNSISIHTGQHFDDNMSKIFFDELKISKPQYSLSLNNAKSHGAQTALMLTEIEQILIKEAPQGVLVYGDTNSTLAGALAAAKLNIPIIHIEAGLRSFNREMPEEVNRVLTDHISKLLFAPTQQAIENLAKEGIVNGVYKTGDVMRDSLDMMLPYLRKRAEESYYFVTLHRPYNTDSKDRLVSILSELNKLDKKVIFPVHPRTVNNLKLWNVDLDSFKNISFIDPVGYEACLSFQAHADCVITDSGGIQKEAYMLKKQCITLRTETEWVETLEGGCNTLVFEDLSQIPVLLNNSAEIKFKELYGNGQAAEEIASIIESAIA